MKARALDSTTRNGDFLDVLLDQWEENRSILNRNTIKPLIQIWRYGATDENLLRNIHYSALEQTQIDVQTLEGQMEPEVLLAGNLDGSFRSQKLKDLVWKTVESAGKPNLSDYFSVLKRVVNGLLKTSLRPPSGSTTTLSIVQDIFLWHELAQCLVSIIKSMGAWMDQQLKISDSDLPRSFESGTSLERPSTSII
ncbi:hypothetical protein GOBAR_AA01287 [Gossypium barbadense]|uniref:Uncharacterized protein n=1 Tax=Gossypium barbadense TaxID=3634 RepID=A0A2P5YUM0_GOSBA|nr:hypothetical protein GOBAR_AA01287 [Gossypium barbadense]